MKFYINVGDIYRRKFSSRHTILLLFLYFFIHLFVFLQSLGIQETLADLIEYALKKKKKIYVKYIFSNCGKIRIVPSSKARAFLI